MKKIFTLIGLMAVTAMSWAQTNYTVLQDFSKSKLTNADFSADPVETTGIRTYDYDMPDEGAGNGGENVSKFGMQPITGWTANAPSNNKKVMTTSKDPVREDGANARACGVYQIVDESEMDAYYGVGNSNIMPCKMDEHTGSALGMLAVWGAKVQYTQDVTLPAGAYAIIIPICNTLGGNSINSLNGFITADGTQYLSKKSSYAVDPYTWVNDTIAFMLEKETTGKISIGYTAPGAGSANCPHLYYDCVNLYQIDPTPLQAEKIAAAKEELNKLLKDADQLGADSKEATKVYNDANATLKQVEDAIESQKKINESAVTDLSSYFISNPHFTEDEAIGMAEGAEKPEGITTYDYDRSKNGVSYYGMQPVKGWVANHPAASIEENPIASNTGVNNGGACGVVAIGSGAWIGGSQYAVPSSMSDGSKEGQVLGFVTCWGFTTQYTQNVSIPAGKYTLSISYYNTGGTNEVARNLMGFVADDGTEYLSETKSFKVGSWEKMTVMFTLEETTSGYFTVGYQAANSGSGSMPHFYIDGIALNYVGETAMDPSLFALQAAVKSGQDLLNEKFETNLYNEFKKSVDAGAELTTNMSNDADANKKAMDAINNMMTDVNANITAYKNLNDFYDNDLDEAVNKYADLDGYKDLADKLNNLLDDVMEAKDDYLWTTAQINEAISSLPTMIKEETQKMFDAAKEGTYKGGEIDLTPILEGLGYTYSTAAQSGANVPDKQWSYGDASNFKTQYGTAEVWNQSPFKVSQTITDMPAGTYTISTKAFYRTADNATNYANYDTDKTAKAFIFAGHMTSPLLNVAELAGNFDNAPSGWAAASDGATTYVPNSQSAAYEIFNNKEYDEKVKASASTALASTGDLTFGVSASEMEGNCWTVWYSFEIKYNPEIDEELLAGEIDAIKQEISTCLEDNIDYISSPVNAAAAEALAGNDMKALLQTVEDLEDNIEAMKAVFDAESALEDIVAEYASTASQSALDAYSDLTNKMGEQTDYTTEELVNLKNEVTRVGSLLKMPTYEGASDSNPIDFTSVIASYSYENEAGEATMEGWTNTNLQTQSNTSFSKTGNIYCERWHFAGNLDINQTIYALPAGTYELKVDAYSQIEDATIYANENEAVIGVTETADAEPMPATPVSLIFVLTKESDVKIGVKATETASTWFCIDNWSLTYYGTESEKEPTAIESATSTSAASTSAIYSASGAKVSSLQKGINIVKMADGKVKKIYVK